MIRLSVLLVLLMVLAGYIYNSAPWKKYELEQSGGAHTTLICAISGLMMFVLSACFIMPFKYFGYDSQLIKLSAGLLFPYPGAFSDITLAAIEIGLLAVVLAKIIPTILLWFLEEKVTATDLACDAFRHSSTKSEFTEILFESLSAGMPVLFTMKDKKVYVGYPVELKYANFNDIQIVPVYSGYREKDTLELKLTVPYEMVIEKMESDDTEFDIKQFLVSMPLREISHAHLFDFQKKNLFDQQQNEFNERKTTAEGEAQA